MAAIQRLDGGASVAEVARAFEVNPESVAPVAEGIPAWSG